MNKKIALSALLLLTFSGAAAFAQNTINSIPDGDNTKEELSVPKINSSQRVYTYPDNSQADISKFDIQKKKVESRKLKTGLLYKSVRLVKYVDYLEDRKKQNTGVLENFLVHPNRQVFLVEIDAPNGLELPSKPPLKRAYPLDGQQERNEQPRTIKIKKAKLLHVFDAETGDFLSSDIIEVNAL